MDYLKRLDDSKDELIRRLSELAAIRSVVEASEGDMPFGRGVQEAFEYFLHPCRYLVRLLPSARLPII